jgi:hypothetical protein
MAHAAQPVTPRVISVPRIWLRIEYEAETIPLLVGRTATEDAGFGNGIDQYYRPAVGYLLSCCCWRRLNGPGTASNRRLIETTRWLRPDLDTMILKARGRLRAYFPLLR